MSDFQNSRLRDFLRRHWNACSRMRIYAFWGVALTLVGLGVMYITVDHLSVNLFLAQVLVVPVIMFVVSYIVHRHRSFGDRQLSDYRSQKRYAAVRFGGWGVSKVSFVMLVAVVGLPYLLASIMITAGLAYPTYKLNRDWAFVQEEEKTKSA